MRLLGGYVVECLPSRHKILGLIPSPERNKREPITEMNLVVRL